MNKYCIITPTYIEHFKYIKEYLKSFDKYVIDKEKVSLIFTVNKDEIPALKDLIAPYKNKIDIICVNFDDILLEHNVFFMLICEVFQVAFKEKSCQNIHIKANIKIVF